MRNLHSELQADIELTGKQYNFNFTVTKAMIWKCFYWPERIRLEILNLHSRFSIWFGGFMMIFMVSGSHIRIESFWTSYSERFPNIFD